MRAKIKKCAIRNLTLNGVAILWHKEQEAELNRFEIFAFEVDYDLETRITGHSISLQMTPFDCSRMILYSRSTV